VNEKGLMLDCGKAGDGLFVAIPAEGTGTGIKSAPLLSFPGKRKSMDPRQKHPGMT